MEGYRSDGWSGVTLAFAPDWRALSRGVIHGFTECQAQGKKWGDQLGTFSVPYERGHSAAEWRSSHGLHTLLFFCMHVLGFGPWNCGLELFSRRTNKGWVSGRNLWLKLVN